MKAVESIAFPKDGCCKIPGSTSIRNLRAQEAQYLSILKQARTVKDTLEVSEKLNPVRGEIEQQQAEFETLARQVETVAVSVSFALRSTGAVVWSAVAACVRIQARDRDRTRRSGQLRDCDVGAGVLLASCSAMARDDSGWRGAGLETASLGDARAVRNEACGRHSERPVSSKLSCADRRGAARKSGQRLPRIWTANFSLSTIRSRDSAGCITF